MGAHTGASILKGPVEIVELHRSKTGHHWEEEVTVYEGGTAFIADISNNGTHYCYASPATPLEEVEKEFGELPCGLPARLHKDE